MKAIEDKLKAVQRFNNKETAVKIARNLVVGDNTITEWKNNKMQPEQ